MAGGRLALDAGWLLVVVLIIGLACATAIAVRRTLIERGGSVDCGLRRGRDRRWRLGLAAYQPGELAWYPVFGIMLRPAEVFTRSGLSVVSRRPADPVEESSLGPGTVVVECDTAGGRIELALGEDALTGFLAWLEAAPPGPFSGFG